jgi:hypothetical protein
MLHVHVLKSWSKSPSRGQLAFLQDCKSYSSRLSSDSEAADLDAAREWFQRFNKATIPEKIAKTEFSRSSGAGGQGVNKYVEESCTVNCSLIFVQNEFKGNHCMGITFTLSSCAESSPPRTSKLQTLRIFLRLYQNAMRYVPESVRQ